MSLATHVRPAAIALLRRGAIAESATGSQSPRAERAAVRRPLPPRRPPTQAGLAGFGVAAALAALYEKRVVAFFDQTLLGSKAS
jgi:hypothetical protein